MDEQRTKQAIQSALKDFGTRPPAEAASHLFEVLGYTSTKRLKLTPNNLDKFLTTFAGSETLNNRLAFPTIVADLRN